MVSSVIYLLKRVATGIVLQRRQFGTGIFCMSVRFVCGKTTTAVLLYLTHLLLGLSNPCVDVHFVSNLRKRGEVVSFGVFKLKIDNYPRKQNLKIVHKKNLVGKRQGPHPTAPPPK